MSFSALIGFHGAIQALEGMPPAKRSIEYAANALFPNRIPDPEKIMDLYRRGWVSASTMINNELGHGICLDQTGQHCGQIAQQQASPLGQLWQAVYDAGQTLPTLREWQVATNRGFFLPEDSLDWLQKLGYQAEDIKRAAIGSRFEVPGPSDLVRFAVRHVFEPDLIRELGYNDEYRPYLDIFHYAQGLTYPILGTTAAMDYAGLPEELQLAWNDAIDTYKNNDVEIPTWAQCYWWAHWILPSPTQGYEMYFRLRPDRDRKFDPPFAKELDFDLDKLNLLLRANDYPPVFRPLLAAIAHRVPGIRFMRQLRATDVYSQRDLYELLRRQGYSEFDAQQLAESIERQDRTQRRKGIESQARGQIMRYWELGIIDMGEAQKLLAMRGMSPEEVQDTSDLAELDLRAKRATSVITQIKRQFIRGKVDSAEAGATLRRFGLTEDRIALYLQEWQLELQTQHREISASKAVQLACRGLISIQDLVSRLDNLGYSRDDQQALKSEAEACAADRAVRLLAQQAREEERSQRRLKQIQREAKQAIQEARRQLASHGTPVQLRKWFCEGHIGSTELYTRLRFLGWPDIDITRLISDCSSGTKQPKTPPPGQGAHNGQAKTPG